MLAAKVASLSDIRFPVLASPKIDGIRLRVMNGVAMSRSMKPLPNKELQAWVSKYAYILNGVDGEVIVGLPTDPDCYTKTVSHIMSEDKQGPFKFIGFDMWNSMDTFDARLYVVHENAIEMGFMNMSVHHIFSSLNHVRVFSLAGLEVRCEQHLRAGYEGTMTRDPTGYYKHGKSTPKEQGLIKIKAYEDDEAVIIGMEEQMHNNNEATINELGRTARSSHQENLVPMGTMGALICRGTTGRFEGVEFNVGGGFSAEQRAEFWTGCHLGKTITYKHFPIGVKDKPRHPGYLRFRQEGA
jgi:DNA ligase-1